MHLRLRRPFRTLILAAFLAVGVSFCLYVGVWGPAQARLVRDADVARDALAERGRALADAAGIVAAVRAELRTLRAPGADSARVAADVSVARRRLAYVAQLFAGAPAEARDRPTAESLGLRRVDGARAPASAQAALADLRTGLAHLDSVGDGGRLDARTDEAMNRIEAAIGQLTRETMAEGDTWEDRFRRRESRLATLSTLGALALLAGWTGLAFWLVAAHDERSAALASAVEAVADEGAAAAVGTEGDELDASRRALERLRLRLHAAEAEAAELRQRAVAAETAGEAKTRFIGNVSHEFRTPLSSIIGFGALLSQDAGRLGEERRSEYLAIILRNARHLLHVVNDLLNLSKVEAGTLEVTLAPVSAGDVASAVVASLRPAAEERGIALVLEDGARRLAVADAGRLRQVLLNLVDNAVKYAPPGTRVEVATFSVQGEVRVEVRDQGPGIAPEERARLFKEFSRIPRAARVAGAGLGLALAKRLTEAMGGRIGVESAPARGSVFWVALPAGAELGRVAEAPPAEVRPPAPRGGRVAVVDDDPDIRALAAVVLEDGGYAWVEDDGSAGVAERLAAAGPDAVLLDVNLAGRTGGEVVAELRARPELARVPVIAFTAAAAPSESAVRAMGFDAWLMKPAEPDELVARIDSLIATGREGAAMAPSERMDGWFGRVGAEAGGTSLPSPPGPGPSDFFAATPSSEAGATSARRSFSRKRRNRADAPVSTDLPDPPHAALEDESSRVETTEGEAAAGLPERSDASAGTDLPDPPHAALEDETSRVETTETEVVAGVPERADASAGTGLPDPPNGVAEDESSRVETTETEVVAGLPERADASAGTGLPDPPNGASEDETPGVGATRAEAATPRRRTRGRPRVEPAAGERTEPVATVEAETRVPVEEPPPPDPMAGEPTLFDLAPLTLPAPLPREVEPVAEDDAFLTPLRRKFRAGLAGRLAAIEAYAASGDVAGLTREVHKLRGTAAGYGFARLAAAGDAAEAAIHAGARSLEHPALAHLAAVLRSELRSP